MRLHDPFLCCLFFFAAFVSAVTPEQVADAAVALHDLLSSSGWEHAFCGGLELTLLGIDRTTSDVDVEVKTGSIWSGGFDRLKATLKQDGNFAVFDGNRRDGIRALHLPSNVGVDIWYRGGDHFPDYTADILVRASDGLERLLPFYNLSHLFVEKFRTAAERLRPKDAFDLVFLFDAYGGWLDEEVIRGRLEGGTVRRTLERYPELLDCATRLALEGIE